MAQPRDFGFGSDEQMVRDQTRKLLDEHSSVATVRRLAGEDPAAVYERGELPGFDAGTWGKCVELGWTMLAVPEEVGGVGAKAVGVAALVEEVGRHAFASPLVPTLICTYVLREAGSEQARAWLGKVAEGATLSLALSPADGSWELDATEVRGTVAGGVLTLDGSAWFVQDAFKVDAFLVAARTAAGIALAVVDRAAPGVSIERDHIVDLTRDQAHVVFRGVEVQAVDVVAPAPSGLGALARAWPAALTLVAADLVGAAEWLLQTTVEYAKVRRQFDRSIGFFQAVKHPLVNAMMDIDRARSLVYNAACAIDTGEDATVPARMAKSQASDAAAFMSSRAVQLHGGIGFTWECDVHLFFKRSRHNQALYGDGVYQRAKLAELLIGPL